MEDKDKQCRISYASSLTITRLPGLWFRLNEDDYVVDLDVADALRLFIDNPYESSDKLRHMAGYRIAVWFYHAILIILRRLRDPNVQDFGFLRQDSFFEELQQTIRYEYPDAMTMPKCSGSKIKILFKTFSDARRVYAKNTLLYLDDVVELEEQEKYHDFVYAIDVWNSMSKVNPETLAYVIDFIEGPFMLEGAQRDFQKAFGRGCKISMATSPWEVPPPNKSFSAWASTNRQPRPGVNRNGMIHGERMARMMHEAFQCHLEQQKLEHAAEISRLQSEHASQLVANIQAFKVTIEHLTDCSKTQSLRHETEIKDLTESHEARISDYEDKIGGLEKASQAQRAKHKDEMAKSSASINALEARHQEEVNSLHASIHKHQGEIWTLKEKIKSAQLKKAMSEATASFETLMRSCQVQKASPTKNEAPSETKIKHQPQYTQSSKPKTDTVGQSTWKQPRK